MDLDDHHRASLVINGKRHDAIRCEVADLACVRSVDGPAVEEVVEESHVEFAVDALVGEVLQESIGYREGLGEELV